MRILKTLYFIIWIFPKKQLLKSIFLRVWYVWLYGASITGVQRFWLFQKCNSLHFLFEPLISALFYSTFLHEWWKQFNFYIQQKQWASIIGPTLSWLDAYSDFFWLKKTTRSNESKLMFRGFVWYTLKRRQQKKVSTPSIIRVSIS